MSRLHLIARDNGAGLSRDLRLLVDTLMALDLPLQSTGLPHRSRFAEWWTRLCWHGRPPRFALNLMLERIRPEFCRAARRNVLIPNPEYFRPQDLAALSCIDEVWCKTHHAERIFHDLGKRTRYLGFTSPDRYDPAIPRRHAFFHGPGRSGNKGTLALFELWAAHPEWPELTVVWRRKRVNLDKIPANVRLIREHLDDAAYRRLQNTHRFHLCPSQTEGFGHYLVEAMSCGAVVVTLDAEPMNELVSATRGVLVQAHVQGRQDLATCYETDPVALQAAIQRCINMEQREVMRLGEAARRWFEHNAAAFRQRLREAVSIQPPSSPLETTA